MKALIHFFLIYLLCLAFPSESLMVSDLSTVAAVEKGENKQIQITLSNEKNTPEQVDLKLYDYRCNSEGQNFFEPAGSLKRSNASWISLNSHRLQLGPKEKSTVYLTVNVPNNQDLIGSYWSVLMIEPADPIQSLREAKEGMQLNVKVRFAHHLVTTIGQGIPKLKIVNKDLKTISDKKYLAFDVENIGEFFLNPKLTLKMYNSEGKLEKTLLGQPERLYPGNTQRYLLDGDEIQGKKYKSFLVFDNDDGHLFADTFELFIP